MNLLEQVTHDILAQYGPFRLGHLTLVFPTRRAGMMIAELLRESLEKQNIRRPMLAPEVTTLSELFESLSTLGREDDIRQVAILYQVYQELAEDCPPFELFFPWGRRLITDFSNIDKGYPDVEPLSFLRHTASAHDLETMKLDDEVRERLQDLIRDTVLSQMPEESLHASYEKIWQLLPELYTRFREALGERTYEGARMKDVLMNWETERVQKRIEGRHFIFAGFNYIVPAERELMLRLKAAGKADFYWDYPTQFACNPKAFKWVKQNAEQVVKANRMAVEAWQPKEVELIASDSVNAQARYVKKWLKDNHHPGERTAIVLCDETLLQDVIAALPGDDGTGCFSRINISKGFPMSHTPIYAAMMAYLTDPRNERQPDESYAAVLDRLIAALPEPEKVKKNTDSTDNPDETEQEEVLVEWTTLLAREAYYQLLLALNRFRLLLEDPNLLPLRSMASLRRLIKRYVQSISLPFHGEPIADIQVVGVLETRSLDFDNILLLNVEEGIVPQVKEEDSFVPFFLRKAYSMPTVEEATDVYAYNFFRLLRRPKKVTLCYTGSENKNNRKSPSRFVIQMMASSDFVLDKHILTAPANIGNDLLTGRKNEKHSLRSILQVDESGYLYNPKKERRYTLSPSAISSYLTCPMQFYYRYVLEVEPAPEKDSSFTRAEVGQFVHMAIQKAYEHLHDDKLVGKEGTLKVTKALIETLDEKTLSEILDIAYAEMNREYRERHTECKADPYVRSEHESENAFIMTAVQRILEKDAELAGEGNLTILAQEQYATFTLDLNDGNAKIQVGGRIDRVDELKGAERIVDYKTGNPDEKKLKSPVVAEDADVKIACETLFPSYTKPGHWLQTLLYSHAWYSRAAKKDSKGKETEPRALIYYPRDTEKVCYDVQAEASETFLKALQQLVTTILNDQTLEPVQEGKCDSFCPFYELCGRPKPKDYTAK